MSAAAPPSPNTAATTGERLLQVLLVVAALLQVAAFAWFVPGNDWARDLVAADAIVRGEGWPLRGPIVRSSFHLGPLWYWLLALPVGIGAGLAGSAVFVGALATLKVALAWRLGARLGGRALALPLAAFALLPGWNLLTALQLTHTAVLETLLYAALLPLLTLARDGRARAWLGFGALAGLAVQAHPVAGFLVFPAAAVLWRRRSRLRGELPWLLAGVLVALLPWLPALVAEMREGWPVLARLAQPEGRAAGPGLLPGLLGLLAASTGGAAAAVRDFLPATTHAAVVGGFVLVFAPALATLPALHRDGALAQAWRAAFAAWLLAAVLLVAVRATVPFYMAALLLPAQALLLALPLAAAWRTGWRWAAGARATAVAAALGLAIAGNLGVIATMRSGHAALPLANIHDIRADAPRVPLALLPMNGFERLATQTCAQSGDGARGADAADAVLRVHGELAALVDFYQSLPFAWRCPRLRVELSGGDDGRARHWAGATPHTLRVLGFADAGWDAAFALQPVRIIAADAPVPLVEGPAYPHRAFADGEAIAHVFAFDGAADEAVAAYAPLFVFDGGHVVGATCDGDAVVPASSTNSGALFLPPPGRGCRWRLEIASRRPQQFDVVMLPMGRGR
ncbi:glycosyltransferase family 39 protein [Arenimonas composti]|uniref:Glycosyltransferase RgtA/B/C/D-like domain-containing protein n=1 Tax=Arenimonas composti TR7-09 = DSM 18010 TaxID=1121013 RepID=A0A091BIE3_9GAMM|nr:glycosyltransferase family 39 protein [Arenimonas composti]KFN51307.1 hypothetical protein P873_03300 [Arenimonas composti TR7-09 = DSM 18010]